MIWRLIKRVAELFGRMKGADMQVMTAAAAPSPGVRIVTKQGELARLALANRTDRRVRDEIGELRRVSGHEFRAAVN